MSPINPNGFTAGFASGAAPGTFVAPDGFGQAGLVAAAPGDDIRLRPGTADFAPWNAAGNAGAAPGTPQEWSAGTLLNAFVNAISTLFAGLGSLLSSAAAQPAASPPGLGQSFFKDAVAGSVGDPHDSFSGTTQAGGKTSAKWDNMQAHPDLLSSDSFAGGYRVSTSVTSGAGGVTQNERATVTTDGGATSVTLNQDGSYAATAQGRPLDLQTGRATALGYGGATVTLNADRSLSIDDRTAAGGELRTTLKPNGTGGVDVTSDAHGVDLGGYLVHDTDRQAEPQPLTGADDDDAYAQPGSDVPDAWPVGSIRFA